MALQTYLDELRTLDPQNPAVWPTWVHIGATVLAMMVIIGAGLYLLVKPQTEVLESREREEIVLRTDFEAKQKKVAALDAYKAQLAEMEKSFGAMLRQLPSRAEVANLLNDIAQTRIASSLDEELFQPQPEIPKEFYAEVPNKIIVVGGYHEMGTFVSGVAALPRIVVIDEVEIKPLAATARGAAQAAAAEGELRMTALAKTYRYLDEEEIAEAEASQKAKAGGAAR
ncbi:MAG TPA: type 4a pilus biogenesis protein PilO [Nevskiaceae bacterium]|nr:type 4a pilus biogenesis protein PilO [Nevskiaceae bacterium]